MKFPIGVRKFNKKVTNRLTSRIARSRWGPFSIVYHRGRHTGKRYQMPIITVPDSHSFLVALTYGADVDWYQNVRAAGRCQILWHRHPYAINKVEPLDTKAALPNFPPLERAILRLLGTHDFVKLQYQS